MKKYRIGSIDLFNEGFLAPAKLILVRFKDSVFSSKQFQRHNILQNILTAIYLIAPKIAKTSAESPNLNSRQIFSILG